MFDRIFRCFLWQKIISETVSSKVTIAIKSMYCSTKAWIRYKGINSDFINSKFVVKQGDPSNSLLCLFFLNDIIQHINTDIDGIVTLEELKLFLLFFANDAVLLAQNPRSLQSMLSDVETYCNPWGMKLNVNKTKCKIIELGRPASCIFLYL